MNAMTRLFAATMLALTVTAISATAKEEKPAVSDNKYEKAVFGGGCFWCVEAIFDDYKGVKSAVSGYAGGHLANPTYQAICTGRTGHAEVVEITFDPKQVSFRELVEVFMDTHDPTTLNRQGNDVGTQYRSVIFCKNDDQKKVAKAVIKELEKQKVFDDPIVTEIADDTHFWIAEKKHQDYFERNPNQGYCQVVIRPKVEKFKKKLAKEQK